MTESVEKVRAKERFLNNQHDSLREDYREVKTMKKRLLLQLCVPRRLPFFIVKRWWPEHDYDGNTCYIRYYVLLNT